MFKGIIRILISYSLIVFALLLSISLASFSLNDLLFYTTSPNTPPINTLGSLGTYITTPFVFFYGKSSWIWTIFSLFAGIRLLTGITPKDLLIRFVLTHYLALMLAVFFALLDSSLSFLSGGVFGALIVNLLTAVLPNIVWIPFAAVAFILGFFGLFHFPSVLFQKFIEALADKMQARKLVTENSLAVPLQTLDKVQNMTADSLIENDKEYKRDEDRYFEDLGSVKSSLSEEQGFVYQKQVPSFLQEVNFGQAQDMDNQEDIPIYFTKKRISRTQESMFRDVEVDLLSPYFRSQSPFYKQIEQNQENLESPDSPYKPKIDVFQDTAEGLDDLEQSSDIMMPASGLVVDAGINTFDLMNHKHPATRLSFSQGFVEEELEIEDVPVYQKQDKEQNTHTGSNKENPQVVPENKDKTESGVQEEIVFSVPQHISNFPPIDSSARDPLILNELDEDGNEIENSKIPSVLDMVSTPITTELLSDSEKILIQGLERTILRNQNKAQALKEKLNKRQKQLADSYYQNIGDQESSSNSSGTTDQVDIQDSLKLYSLEQEIQELKKDSSLGASVSQVIEDGSFLKQHQEYVLNSIDDKPGISNDILVQDDMEDVSASNISSADLLQELMMPIVEEDDSIKDILSVVPSEVSQETDAFADLASSSLDNTISVDKLLEDEHLSLMDTALDSEDVLSNNIEDPLGQELKENSGNVQSVDSENLLDNEDLYINFDDIVTQDIGGQVSTNIQKDPDNMIPAVDQYTEESDFSESESLLENSQDVPIAVTVETAEPSFSFLEGALSSTPIPYGKPPSSNPHRNAGRVQEELMVIDSSNDEESMGYNSDQHDINTDFTFSGIKYSDSVPVEKKDKFAEIGNLEELWIDDEEDTLTALMSYDGESFMAEPPKEEKAFGKDFADDVNIDSHNILKQTDYSTNEDLVLEDLEEEKFVENDLLDDVNIDGGDYTAEKSKDYYNESFIPRDLEDNKVTVDNFTDILNLENENDVLLEEPIESEDVVEHDEHELSFAVPIDPDNELEEIFAENTNSIIVDTSDKESFSTFKEEHPINDLQEPESLLMPSVVTDTHLVSSISYPVADSYDTVDTNNKAAHTEEKSSNTFVFPRVEDLEPNTDDISREDEDQELEATMKMIEDTYESFNINMQVVDYNRGPTITRFELEPPSGLKLRTILNLQDDLALQAGTSNLRIISPVEGRSLIGIEVPNKVRRNFLLREQIESSLFQNSKAALPLILGVDVGGKEIVGDLATTPHLLIAGTTGSGKSVYVNALIMGLLFKLSAEDLKFIMIDPKMVELELYSGIPHLLAPIITKPEEAMAALDWAVQEMDRRYKLLSNYGVRNIKEYQELIKNTPIGAETYEKLPYIVVIVDEFASLMLRAPKDTEKYISRLASMSRAVGIHLVLATQRPSVDVVTGVIKANFPSRIAFRVSSKIDSRTIVDKNGAETLLGRGDMLFMSPEHMDLIRIQSPYASSEDIARTVSTVKKNGAPNYTIDFSEVLARQEESNTDGSRTDALNDPLFEEVLRYAVDNGEISASGIQRRFRVGYNRASRLIESMKDMKIISPPPSAGKGWLINITRDEIMDYID